MAAVIRLNECRFQAGKGPLGKKSMAAAVGGRESAAEEASSRPAPGQGHAAGSDPKKRMELAGRRTEVAYLRARLVRVSGGLAS